MFDLLFFLVHFFTRYPNTVMAVEPFGRTALTTALVAASLLAYRATRKRTLTRAGAAAGFVVGFTIVATGMRGLILFYFYQVGTWATKYKLARKIQLDGTLQTSSERGASQVLCASILATILSVWHAWACGAERPIYFPTHSSSQASSDVIEQDGLQILASYITCGILAHHATCLADTLASEMGILAQASPVLVTRPWQRVPAGTNGGVTMSGFMWSFIGGALIGFFYVVTDWASGTTMAGNAQVAIVMFGGTCGLLGSLVDSIMGATLQSTYYDTERKQVFHANENLSPSLKLICGSDILSNERVNLFSTAITTYFGGWILAPWFFSLFNMDS